ncbi:MAG: oligopeptide transport system permease protein [Thermomicrobiales bacterium]|jgi:ABC-type dipeptide/oligopeptide/nickel transport system permease component|nr:oligopeptide transport system permease protein [Thermomicrobiales bacterium]
MARYILGRLISLIFVLLAVSLIAFFLMHAVPGGPFDVGERRLPEATRQAQLRKYGLDQPILVQYVKYIWHVLHFDFGVPFQRPTETVTSLIGSRWPVTIKIGIPTILVAYTFGTFFGFVAAVRQNSWIDYLVTTVGTLGLTVQSWVIGIWLILLLSVQLKLLPTGGWGDWKHYLMPVAAYSLAPMALVARYTRVSILEVLRADYVRTARAKGLGERRVLLSHVARNSLIPWVTVLLPEIPNILTGSIFIESVFRIPGLGGYFATSMLSRDYPMILAVTLLIAVLWGLTYLLTDILYTVLDPRIRLTGTRVKV